MARAAATIVFVSVLASGQAMACPDGQSKGALGWCYPNIGGGVGEAWEKGKREMANFERDVRTWIETGKCGGDICDAFAAAVEFGEAQIEDIGASIERAGERLAEGKPLDAIWHLHTDYLNNTQENAAQAAFRSRVLAATGQVAAAAYGGPGGAAAYTAWLTYNATSNVGDALKAGMISGATAYAAGGVNSIELSGASGIAARSILTGAVNGAAVAASGGTDADIRAAVGMGVATVLIRESYRELTSFELDERRLRSSTGEAYCLAESPPAAYFSDAGAPSSCFAPPSTYIRQSDGTYRFDQTKFRQLDPDRPHVGVWARQTEPIHNIAAENSGVMTGISRLPGWNAMAVGHDELSVQMRFDLLPGGTGIVPTVATIPPSVVLTYVGSGGPVHDSIREAFVRRQREREAASRNASPNTDASVIDTRAATTASTVEVPFNEAPTEVLHVFCGTRLGDQPDLERRTDIVVNVSVTGDTQGGSRRLCEVHQRSNGHWYELGHAHHQRNYCHTVAERIARQRVRRGYACYGSVGLRDVGDHSTGPVQASRTEAR